MTTANEIKRYSDEEVLASQPGMEGAMLLVRANALESGATADRMFLKVRAGKLAGLDLLWDQPSRSWVEKAGVENPKRRSDREHIASLQEQVNELQGQLRVANELIQALDPSHTLDHACLCGAPLPSGVEQCEECRKGFGDQSIFEIIADGLEASVDGRGYGPEHHKAVKMANAAPKLLEALKALHAYTREVDAAYRNALEGTIPLSESVYAAIAEAEGKGGASC